MKLLIAHGDVTSRDALREMTRELTRVGLEPLESGEGAHALSLLLDRDGPDLAVVDWDLPGCGGPELCRQVRAARRSRPPYIILLAPGKPESDEAFAAGADDCVAAGAGEHELKARIFAARRRVMLA